MAVNLLRNARVFFTTALDADNNVNVADVAFNTKTQEIQVLDGFSFTQNTTTETVELNEAGDTPNRGQRMFNTALDPVEFSMSTYIRPYDAGAAFEAEESYLWNALMGKTAIGSAGAAWVAAADSATATLTKANSNVHQLQAFGLIIQFDSTEFRLNNCALDSATIDFGLDAIATIQWSGRGTTITQSETKTTMTGVGAKKINAKYIANKLSTVSLKGGIGGTGDTYTVPITGGSITIANNLTYLTPANLGVVNKPITYFTGTRAVSGSLTAYLRTGTSGKYTGELMADVLSQAATSPENSYELVINVGGASGPRAVLNMEAAMLSIPTVTTEQVVSTEITFTSQGYTGAVYDIEEANELTVTYYAA